MLEELEDQQQPEEEQQQVEEQQQDKEWDKERQRADQEAANARKARQRAEKLESDLQSANDRLSALEAKLEAKAEAEGLNVDDIESLNLDEDFVDPKVKGVLKDLVKQVRDANKKVSTLEKKANQYEQTEAERQAESRRKAERERLLAPLDKKYGAKFRNDALTLADKKIADGTATKPQDILEARDLLEDCYRELKGKAESKKASSVPTDNGVGGTASFDSGLTEGSRTEVLAQIRKKGLKSVLGKK